ncbi:Thiosulfate sulfurtransferase [Planctomycetes bacterium MalM25]|nr:Thiosulfate sulfurtransferase [Planctomycetes bacterium MalM25]
MHKPFPAALLPVAMLCAVGPLFAEEYAPGVLIEAEELKRLIESSDRDLCVLDIRSPDEQRHGSVPGAKAVGGFFDFRSAFGPGGKPEPREGVGMTLHHLLGQHPPSRVVLLGDSLDPSVARAWWQLRYLGVRGAMVLNGGWQAWQAVDGPVEQAQGGAIVGDFAGPLSVFEVQPQTHRLVVGGKLRALIASRDSPTLIDARSEREYADGCLPGAKRLEWSGLIDADSGELLPADELRAKFAAAGIDPREPAIAYCRSGGRASVTVLALAALGSERVANYYGSWNEWSQLPDAPIERPDAEAAP